MTPDQPEYVPAAYPDARVRYRRGDRSDRTGRTAGERVAWSIPAGHPIYPEGSGEGMVLVPDDGGFVWLDSGSIVPAEFCRPLPQQHVDDQISLGRDPAPPLSVEERRTVARFDAYTGDPYAPDPPPARPAPVPLPPGAPPYTARNTW